MNHNTFKFNTEISSDLMRHNPFAKIKRIRISCTSKSPLIEQTGAGSGARAIETQTNNMLNKFDVICSRLVAYFNVTEVK